MLKFLNTFLIILLIFHIQLKNKSKIVVQIDYEKILITFLSFDSKSLTEIKNILTSKKINTLIKDVCKSFHSTEIIIECNQKMDGHGGYDPESEKPKILINPKTGLTESNLAHELIHAIQIKLGYPTTPKRLYAKNDIRASVIRELVSSLTLFDQLIPT